MRFYYGGAIVFIGIQLKDAINRDLSVLIVAFIIMMNMYIFLFSQYPISCQIIKTHDKDLSIMIDELDNYDPRRTAVFVGPYIFYGYRHIMYYLPQYRVYQTEIRISQRGEKRKIFGGIYKETFLVDEVVLPAKVDHMFAVFIGDDKEKVNRREDLTITKLPSTHIYLASGHISLIQLIYPELKVFHGTAR
jgi:hypothetical protein